MAEKRRLEFITAGKWLDDTRFTCVIGDDHVAFLVTLAKGPGVDNARRYALLLLHRSAYKNEVPLDDCIKLELQRRTEVINWGVPGWQMTLTWEKSDADRHHHDQARRTGRSARQDGQPG